MVVFRDDKSLEDERKAWEFWHSRQHSYKQRVIDIGKQTFFLKNILTRSKIQNTKRFIFSPAYKSNKNKLNASLLK